MGKSFLLSIWTANSKKGISQNRLQWAISKWSRICTIIKLQQIAITPKLQQIAIHSTTSFITKPASEIATNCKKGIIGSLLFLSVKANTSLNLIRIIKSQQIAERTFKKLFQTVNYFSFFIIYSANIPFITQLSIPFNSTKQ